MGQWLTQKEPVRYANKLIKKTTDTNYREYLQLTKHLILANITMNDKNDHESSSSVQYIGYVSIVTVEPLDL